MVEKAWWNNDETHGYIDGMEQGHKKHRHQTVHQIKDLFTP